MALFLAWMKVKSNIGHCESSRRMMGRAFALFFASQWGVVVFFCFFTEAYFVYICEL